MTWCKIGHQTFASLSIPEVGYILGKGKTGSRYCDKWPLSLLAPFNDHKLLKRHDLPTRPNVSEQEGHCNTYHNWEHVLLLLAAVKCAVLPWCSSEDLNSFWQVCRQDFGSVWTERWASEYSRGTQAREETAPHEVQSLLGSRLLDSLGATPWQQTSLRPSDSTQSSRVILLETSVTSSKQLARVAPNCREGRGEAEV